MEYIPDFERIKARYEAFWARENHDRPLLSIRAPREDRPPPLPDAYETEKARWLDTDYMIARARHHFESTAYYGEAMAMLCPNLGPDLFAALYGSPLIFGETTSWSEPCLASPEAWDADLLDRQGWYYHKILEMTAAAAADGQGRYLVGVTDLHPGLDALAALRGPQALCIDTLEDPRWVARAALDLFEGFEAIFGDLCAVTAGRQAGTTNWMGLWHPGRWYVTSCDFCCMISPDAFERLVIPELEKELAYLDASIFHLDGPDALRHLDRLLALPALDGIQWVYGAGQPTAAHWIEPLQKIQRAGKCVCVSATAEDLPVLLENMRPEGVLYDIAARDEAEAAGLLRMAEKHTIRLY